MKLIITGGGKLVRKYLSPVVGYLGDSLHGDRRPDDGGGGKGWMMTDYSASHNQITAHRTHAFTTGQSYNQPNGEFRKAN